MTHPALAIIDALKSPRTGERRILRAKFRCPRCRAQWCLEEEIWNEPQPVDTRAFGLALLCGSCEARRRLCLREQDGSLVPLWTPEDDRKAWGALLHSLDRGETAFVPDTSVIPWEDRALADTKKRELERIAYDHAGHRRTALSREKIAVLGLAWTLPAAPAA